MGLSYRLNVTQNQRSRGTLVLAITVFFSGSALVPSRHTAARAKEPSRLTFVDIAGPGRVGYRHQASKTNEKYLLESMGGGVALFDADGDGWLDIYFVNGAALKPPMRRGDLPVKE